MFGRFKQKLSTLYRNLIYLSQQDYKRGLVFMLREGRRLEYNNPTDLRFCPVCNHELERIARTDGVIVTVCPRWQSHPTQVPFPDIERHSDKLPAAMAQAQPGLMLFDYRQKHHDAGPETQTHRSVRLNNSPSRIGGSDGHTTNAR